MLKKYYISDILNNIENYESIYFKSINILIHKSNIPFKYKILKPILIKENYYKLLLSLVLDNIKDKYFNRHNIYLIKIECNWKVDYCIYSMHTDSLYDNFINCFNKYIFKTTNYSNVRLDDSISSFKIIIERSNDKYIVLLPNVYMSRYRLEFLKHCIIFKLINRKQYIPNNLELNIDFNNLELTKEEIKLFYNKYIHGEVLKNLLKIKNKIDLPSTIGIPSECIKYFLD